MLLLALSLFSLWIVGFQSSLSAHVLAIPLVYARVSWLPCELQFHCQPINTLSWVFHLPFVGFIALRVDSFSLYGSNTITGWIPSDLWRFCVDGIGG